MKPIILFTTIAALAALTPLGHSQDDPPVTTTTSSKVTANSDGTATVTIEVNGKKETRTFKLGDDEFQVKLQDGTDPQHGGKKEKETWIGVGIGHAISPEARAQLPIQPGEGISVSHVAAESPAAQAGLAQHDILVRFNDQILVTGDQFKKLVKMRKPGESVKVGYFRKGERKEADVTLAEHESEPEVGDVLRFLGEPEKWDLKHLQDGKWQERLQTLREKSAPWREKLKEAKERHPGVVVDTKAFVLGVDGTVKKLEGELENLEGVIRLLREQLEKADLSKETVQDLRDALDGGIEKAADGARKATLDAIREYQVKRQQRAEAKKAEGQSTQPPPPVAPIKELQVR